MASCIHISLILATLLTQMSSGDQEKCRKAVQDLVKVVASCPRSKTEWDIAASKKNCEQLAAKALCKTSKLPYLYHCVINGFRNQTLEVCAPRKIIIGHCTEYNAAGGVIQRRASAKCNNLFPKCDKSYNSTEAYKYPDCYKIAYKKQDLETMTVQTEEKTTTSKPDQSEKNNPFIYVVIAAVVVICVLVFIIVILCKRHRRSTSNDEEECHVLIENYKDPSIKYLYINAKHLQHFHFVINLAKDCELRLKKVIESENRIKCMSDKGVMIKIVGNLTDDNLNFLPKVNEEKNMRGEMHEIKWGAVPIFCFQNDLQTESALEILRRENACHKILIQSDVFYDKPHKVDGSIIIVGQNKRQIIEIITSCLEKQLDEMLQDWLNKVKHRSLNELTFDIIAEIEVIRKQLIFDTSNNTASPDAHCKVNKCIVPYDVKDYLHRRCVVKSFGIWGRSTFKVFVIKTTDEKELRRKLVMLNPHFFEKYYLKIEKRNMVQKHTMRQYESTSLMYSLGETLKILLTKSYDERKKHENNLAPTDDSRNYRFFDPIQRKVFIDLK